MPKVCVTIPTCRSYFDPKFMLIQSNILSRYINGSNEANETTKFMFATYSVCSCNYQQTVSIGTVDTCGRAGQRTSDITAISKPSLTTELEMDCTLSTGSDCSRVEGAVNHYSNLNLKHRVITCNIDIH